MEAVKSVKGRRRHSEEFKAQLVMMCVQGRRTISSVAVEHKVNASLVHRWISQRRLAAAKGEVSGFILVKVAAGHASEALVCAQWLREVLG